MSNENCASGMTSFLQGLARAVSGLGLRIVVIEGRELNDEIISEPFQHCGEGDEVDFLSETQRPKRLPKRSGHYL